MTAEIAGRARPREATCLLEPYLQQRLDRNLDGRCVVDWIFARSLASGPLPLRHVGCHLLEVAAVVAVCVAAVVQASVESVGYLAGCANQVALEEGNKQMGRQAKSGWR